MSPQEIKIYTHYRSAGELACDRAKLKGIAGLVTIASRTSSEAGPPAWIGRRAGVVVWTRKGGRNPIAFAIPDEIFETSFSISAPALAQPRTWWLQEEAECGTRWGGADPITATDRTLPSS